MDWRKRWAMVQLVLLGWPQGRDVAGGTPIKVVDDLNAKDYALDALRSIREKAMSILSWESEDMGDTVESIASECSDAIRVLESGKGLDE